MGEPLHQVRGPPPGAGLRSRKALVLGHDGRSFLAVIRSLGRRGVEVHVAGHDPGGIASRSRYIARAHALPPWSADESAWLPQLRSLLDAERFDLVLPTDDPSVVALHHARAELSDLRVHLPSPRAFDVAFDKLATWELARSLSIPVPEQALVGSERDLDGLGARLGWPIVLKPRVSYAFGRTKWEHQVRKAFDERELAVYARALLEKGDVLAQSNVLGRGIGVDVLADRGEIVLAFEHERLHEPVHGGGSSYRRSVPLDGELLAAARSLIGSIGHTGVAMVEFKRERPGGPWALIEVNARFWGSLPLALAAGADFPWALWRLVVDHERPDSTRYRAGLYSRNLWMDLAWWMQNRGFDREDPLLASVRWPSLVGELRNVALLRERSDALVLDDWRPGAAEIGRTLREIAGLPASRLRRAALRAPFVRRWLARRVARDLGAARTVLFVCRGNICRSPFAEHAARELLPERVEVLSAGYYPESGRRCPREAVEIARAFGVDLDGHRSRVLDAEMLARADLVLVHDERDRRQIAKHFPSAARKVRGIALLCAEGPVDVRDPYGRCCADYQAAFGAIARALTGALASSSDVDPALDGEDLDGVRGEPGSRAAPPAVLVEARRADRIGRLRTAR